MLIFLMLWISVVSDGFEILNLGTLSESGYNRLVHHAVILPCKYFFLALLNEIMEALKIHMLWWYK